MKESRRLGGFTLIEVAISMVFIGVLSITIVLLIQNVTASYQRGMTLNQVNTVGMDLIDEFRVAVQNSTSDPIVRMCETYYRQESNDFLNCVNDNANSFIMVTRKAEVDIEGSKSEMPVYGAFCTGSYTYIWNTGYFDQENTAEHAIGGKEARKVNGVSPAVLHYNDEGSAKTRDGFWLLRVHDAERSVCINKMEEQTGRQTKEMYKLYDSYDNSKVSNNFYISDTAYEVAKFRGEEGTELLKKDGTRNDLVLYDLYVARPALSVTRANMYFAGTFILGTTRGGININVVGNNCKPPSDEFSELNYCAINKFNFAVQAGGV